MWLKNKYFLLRSYVIYQYSLHWVYRKSNYKTALSHFMCLEPQLYAELNVIHACSYFVKSIVLSKLVEYVEVIHTVNLALGENSKVNVHSFTNKRTHYLVTYEQFVSDRQDRYANVPALVESYKKGCLLLFENYAQIETERLGIPGYNARVLKSLLKETELIATQLRKYPHE